MVKLFAINVKESRESEKIEILLKYVSTFRAKRALAFHNINDSYRTILGELLVKYAIYKNYKGLEKEIKLKYCKGKKPELLFPKDIFFNISHSGEWVICAISHKNVGVDIEKIKEVNFDIIERFFSLKESNYILNEKNNNFKKKKFYQIWTLKESYVKADGRGLFLPFSSFSINIKGQKISLETENKLRRCFFKTLFIDKEYVLSICYLEKKLDDDINVVNLKKLISKLRKFNKFI